MTLIKRPEFPFFWNEKWITDFFDKSSFDSDWMKMMAVPPVPAVNIVENTEGFVIELAAPGLSKKDFNIAIENGVLTISAEKQEEKKEEDKNYTRKEYSFEKFSRSFTLPENVSEDKVKAHYADGILRLELAKKELAKMPARKAIAVA